MAELEQRLKALSAELEWPATPGFSVPAAPPRSTRRLGVAAAFAVLAALAVALAVPGARSAILRALQLEGVTVERVAVLPPAEARPLGSGLGPVVDMAAAERALGRPFAAPPLSGTPELHLRAGVVSLLLSDRSPVLLSEIRLGGGPAILKKIVGGSTGVVTVPVGGGEGLWIGGEEHVFVEPEAAPRLAGHVLLWDAGGVLYRLEGRGLTEDEALRIAGLIAGT